MNIPRNRDQLFGVIAGLLCRAGSFEDTADVCRNPAANNHVHAMSQESLLVQSVLQHPMLVRLRRA